MNVDAGYIILGIIGLIGSLGAGYIGKKVLSKKEIAETEEATQRRERLAVETAEMVIQLVRDDLIKKVEDNTELRVENASLKANQSELERRVDKLEERERHGLVRAAVHEAWDQMAFSKLSNMDPVFPPPPPLTVLSELEERELRGDKQIDAQLGEDGLPDD